MFVIFHMAIADMFMTVCVNICCIAISYMLVIFGYNEEKFFPCSMINSHVRLSLVLQWSMNNGLRFFLYESLQSCSLLTRTALHL